ncbi:MAG: hypothetical protein J7L88_05865 [Thermoplasmata archaeon]|nr:hypothetical protein [Thermoplasmata archaeon]
MDNNLDSIGEWEADLHSLMKVGSTPLSQHIVLYDGDGPNDTVIQHVLPGDVEEYPANIVNETWGEEVNMGDERVLEQFLLWAYQKYPAQRIALVLNDHGGGWRGICWDDTSSDFLSDREVREALQTFYERTGRKIDVLLTYACIMSTIEFLYAIQPYVDFFVGSQTFSWGSETHGDEYLIGNYPFDKIFSALKESPNMTGEEFALHIADSFQPYGPWTAPEFYVYRDYTSDVVAAINLTLIPALVEAVDQLAQVMLDYLRGIRGEVYRSVLINGVIGSPQLPPEYNTQSFSGQMDWLGLATFTNYDLKDFAIQIEKSGAFPKLDEGVILKNIKSLVDATVMEVRHGTDPSKGEHPDAHGISIWLPFRRNEYRDSYEECLLAQDTAWDEFLLDLSQAS